MYYFKDLTDFLVALFPVGSDGVIGVYRQGDETLPSPLQEQFRDAPDGSRVIFFPASGYAPDATLDSQYCEVHIYTIDIYALERWQTEAYPLSRRQELLNFLLSRLNQWCGAVEAKTIEQPQDFRIATAEIEAVDIDTSSPLTEQGWLGAGVRMKVRTVKDTKEV